MQVEVLEMKANLAKQFLIVWNAPPLSRGTYVKW